MIIVIIITITTIIIIIIHLICNIHYIRHFYITLFSIRNGLTALYIFSCGQSTG